MDFPYCLIFTDVEKKYPGVTVLNERVLQCECKENVILNKLRSLTNYTKRKFYGHSCIFDQQRELVFVIFYL